MGIFSGTWIHCCTSVILISAVCSRKINSESSAWKEVQEKVNLIRAIHLQLSANQVWNLDAEFEKIPLINLGGKENFTLGKTGLYFMLLTWNPQSWPRRNSWVCMPDPVSTKLGHFYAHYEDCSFWMLLVKFRNF